MHELQLMRQVVHLVEETCRNQPGSLPSVVRLRISRHSHMADHQLDELETTFRIAAQGTMAEYAKLDIHFFALAGLCISCGESVEDVGESPRCQHCQTEDIFWEPQPEVLLDAVECTLNHPEIPEG